MTALDVRALSIATLVLSLCTVGVVQADSPIEAVVVAPKPGAKLISQKDGSVVTYQPPFSDNSSRLAHPAPRLPPTAAARRLHGKIELSVKVAESGEVKLVTVDRSSGSPLLDEAARAWLQCIWLYPRTERSEIHHEQVLFDPTSSDADDEVKRVLDYARQGRTLPPYPVLALHQGWQGTMRMKLTTDGAGKVGRAEIVKSSGHLFLDLVSKSWCETFWMLKEKNAIIDCSFTYQLR